MTTTRITQSDLIQLTRGLYAAMPNLNKAFRRIWRAAQTKPLTHNGKPNRRARKALKMMEREVERVRVAQGQLTPAEHVEALMAQRKAKTGFFPRSYTRNLPPGVVTSVEVD